MLTVLGTWAWQSMTDQHEAGLHEKGMAHAPELSSAVRMQAQARVHYDQPSNGYKAHTSN